MSSSERPVTGLPTMAQRFAQTVADRGTQIALRAKRADDTWVEHTWDDIADQATRVAGGLRALGLGRGDRVVMLMRNRPEFHVVDLAALLVGATPISIYNSSAPDQIEYLVNHCGAKIAVVEDAVFLERFLSVRDAIPALEHLVLIEDDARPDDVATLGDLLATEPVDLAVAAQIAQPDDLVTVIYTSGTTGPPKGVQLTHTNVCWTVDSVFEAFGLDPTGKRIVSYLPMAHIAERMVSHYQAICFGNIVTCCPDAKDVLQYLGAVRPEIFFGVPRVFEKAAATIGALVGADPAGAAAFDAALKLGLEFDGFRQRNEKAPDDLAAAYEQADAEQLATWRAILGLDEVLTAVSGAAPIAPETFDFFRGLGIPLSEIYGLSETTGPLTWAPFAIRSRSVGPAIPGAEVRLAADGEVLARGGNIFTGYLNEPDKTAEALDADGWFHTGDIGELDDDGYLRIVDRKKELIITAGGKNISPANLESALKGASPVIGQVCVIGDARPFLVALVVLDTEVAPVWAGGKGIADTSLAALSEYQLVYAEVERAVDDVNEHFSKVEGIKKFAILHEEWLPDSLELTPTMKLKRRGIHEKYATQIEALYQR